MRRVTRRVLSRPTIIAGNWKHNPDRSTGESLWREVVDGVEKRKSQLEKVRVLVIPPLPWLGLLGSTPVSQVELGVQHISDCPEGAFTGEVGPALAHQFGARWCLVGHSERRTLFGESDAHVAKRMRAALDHDLKPVLCIGETLEEREAGLTQEVVARQLEEGASLCQETESVVVAYEPVWAIGTGVTAAVEQVEEVHGFLRETLREKWREGADEIPLLYGGSVKADNAGDLLGLDDVDGALVGGASLNAASFLGIVDAGIFAL